MRPSWISPRPRQPSGRPESAISPEPTWNRRSARDAPIGVARDLGALAFLSARSVRSGRVGEIAPRLVRAVLLGEAGRVSDDQSARRRKRVRLVQRYLLNPPMKLMTWLGLVPGHAILETRGRRSGRRRRTVVGIHVDGDTGWVVAEQGRHAGYVRNLEADSAVRVRRGYRWRPARAQVIDGDDPEARLKTFGRRSHAAAVRRFGTDLTTIRVDFTDQASR